MKITFTIVEDKYSRPERNIIVSLVQDCPEYNAQNSYGLPAINRTELIDLRNSIDAYLQQSKQQ